jgi:hypothetical protein
MEFPVEAPHGPVRAGRMTATNPAAVNRRNSSRNS